MLANILPLRNYRVPDASTGKGYLACTNAPPLNNTVSLKFDCSKLGLARWAAMRHFIADRPKKVIETVDSICHDATWTTISTAKLSITAGSAAEGWT